MTYSKIVKAERLNLASEIVGNSNHEFASELAQMLQEESTRVEKANARSRGKKVVSKAQKERAEVIEQVTEVLGSVDPKTYFDSVGLLTLVELDYTPQKAIHVAKDLVEQGLLVDVGNQKFADGKSRKAYALQADATEAFDSEEE